MSRGSDFDDTGMCTSDMLEQVVNGIDSDYITLRDIVRLLGEQGLLLICALLSLPFLFPISIPGVSTVFGAGIILVSVAITINRLPWMPAFVADRKLDTGKLIPVLERGVTVLRRLDRYLKPRFIALTTGAVVNRVNGIALVASGVLLMMPLGLIPFSNTLPGVAILLLSIGISQRDGLLVVLGYLMILATVVYFAVLAYIAFMAGQSLVGRIPYPGRTGGFSMRQDQQLQQTEKEARPVEPKPYGFWRTVVIVLSGHLGVRPSHKREEDFRRANGVHVFVVALMYFILVICGLIVLVNIIAG